jgi:hypothetical protein
MARPARRLAALWPARARARARSPWPRRRRRPRRRAPRAARAAFLIARPLPRRLLRETFEPEMLTPFTTLDTTGPTATVIEVGPRSNFSTAFSTNAVSICQSCGLNQVTRLEKSRRYLLITTRCARPRARGARRRLWLVLLLQTRHAIPHPPAAPLSPAARRAGRSPTMSAPPSPRWCTTA